MMTLSRILTSFHSVGCVKASDNHIMCDEIQYNVIGNIQLEFSKTCKT
jgi:hypothetical protein